MSEPAGVLLIGYGNPGRLDDGLGPAAAAVIEKLGLSGVTVEADYQLVVEDAELAGRHELVIFVDADVAAAEPFEVRPVQPREGAGFSTHSVSPEELMHLARQLFSAAATAFVVAIRGYEFDGFGEGLSDKARENLTAGEAFLAELLGCGNVKQMIAELEKRTGHRPR